MFEFPELLSVGSIMVPFQLLLLIFIAAISYYLTGSIGQSIQKNVRLWKELLANSLILYILVWKLSIIVLAPLSVIQQPTLLLIGNGGRSGHILAMLSVILFAIYWSKKKNESALLFFDLTLLWLVIIFTIQGLLIRQYGLPTEWGWGFRIESGELLYHPISLYQGVLGIVLLVYIYLKKIPIGAGVLTGHALFFIGLGMLIISQVIFFPRSILGFAPAQWGYILMMAVGIIMAFLTEKFADAHT